jgi:hypothetical protein
MPGPIAAAAGGVLIEKVSDEDSIVNTAFKFTLLIGMFITIGLGLFLIYELTSIFDALTDTINNLLNPFGFGGGGFGESGSIFGLTLTALLNPTIFGRSSYLNRLS